MKRPPIVGVMGGGHIQPSDAQSAYHLGRLIALKGWVLLNGGRNAGIMAASAKGARENGGVTVGVLPDADTSQAAKHILIPICTGMGSARNTINVLSSDIVVACVGSAGTLSEIALALKHGKRVITMGFDTGTLLTSYRKEGTLVSVQTPEEVVEQIERFFKAT